MSDRHDPTPSGPLLGDERSQVSLCELLDRVLYKGVVVRGEVVLSLVDIDLVYLGLQLVLCSTDTAARAGLLSGRRRLVSRSPEEPDQPGT